MKKSFVLLCVMTVLSAAAFADQVIDPSTLPAEIQTAVIDFRKTGDWKQIECMAGVPASAVPEKIAAEIAKKFPDIPVVKIEKEYRGYEVKLQNRMELYFNEKGKLIGQKYDD